MRLLTNNPEDYADFYHPEDDITQTRDKRLLIPIVRRAYEEMISPKLVSFQAFPKPASLFYNAPIVSNDACFGAGQLNEFALAARSRKLKVHYVYDQWYAAQPVKSANNLDMECEFCCIIATEVALEWDREVLNDLRNCAAPMKNFKLSNGLKDLEEFHAKQLGFDKMYGYKWIVTSPELAMKILGDKYEEPKRFGLGVLYRGQHNNYHIFSDPLFPVSQILAGLKFGKFGSGYVYAPYMPLIPSDPVYMPDYDGKSMVPRKGFWTQYAAKLVNPNFYVRATCKELDYKSFENLI
jgi:hypothetical protein